MKWRALKAIVLGCGLVACQSAGTTSGTGGAIGSGGSGGSGTSGSGSGVDPGPARATDGTYGCTLTHYRDASCSIPYPPSAQLTVMFHGGSVDSPGEVSCVGSWSGADFACGYMGTNATDCSTCRLQISPDEAGNGLFLLFGSSGTSLDCVHR